MHMIPQVFYIVLTLKVPCISESCIEIKIKLDFYFHTSFWCIKRFYESTIKPFEAPQRSVKRKFNLIFSLCPGLRRKGLILIETYFHIRIFSYNLNYHHLSKVNWRQRCELDLLYLAYTICWFLVSKFNSLFRSFVW